MFDEGWLAVLNLEAWDIHTQKGIPKQYNPIPGASLISETDRTLLHNTLVHGEQEIEDWVITNEPNTSVEVREKLSESFWRTLELLEGVEEGVEGLESIRNGVNELALDRETDDIEADPGLFHGFDDLDDM